MSKKRKRQDLPRTSPIVDPPIADPPIVDLPIADPPIVDLPIADPVPQQKRKITNYV
jgi:hypothetical protein